MNVKKLGQIRFLSITISDCNNKFKDRKFRTMVTMSLFIRLCLVLLVMNCVISSSVALRGYGLTNKGYTIKGNKVTKDPATPRVFGGTSPGLTAQNPSRKGIGISAWGIITLIVTMILAGMGLYYFSICYPILCKKTRKYDIIGLPTAV